MNFLSLSLTLVALKPQNHICNAGLSPSTQGRQQRFKNQSAADCPGIKCMLLLKREA